MTKATTIKCILFIIIAISICLAGCAPSIRGFNKSFTESSSTALRTGMTTAQVEELLGPPSISHQMIFGENTGHPWTGIVFKYYTIRDTKLKYAVRYKTNTLVFDATEEPPSLHHWKLEHIYTVK